MGWSEIVFLFFETLGGAVSDIKYAEELGRPVGDGVCCAVNEMLALLRKGCEEAGMQAEISTIKTPQEPLKKCQSPSIPNPKRQSYTHVAKNVSPNSVKVDFNIHPKVEIM